MIYPELNPEAGDDLRYEATHLLFFRLNTAGVLLTWLCLYAIKLSFLLFYRRIFQISRGFMQAWWVVLVIVVLTFWILIAGSITQCGSPSTLEDVGTSCISMT